jgi:adenylate cyclase
MRHHHLAQIAMGHYYLRDYEAAVEAAKLVIRSYPDQNLAPRWLAAALGQLGLVDEAKQVLQRAIALFPKSFEMSVRQRLPWMRPEDYEHMLEGLRKAGWEG